MTHYSTRRLALSVAVAGAVFAAPATLLAAGFYIQEQGVTGLGRAYAGEAAAANDASTIYFNPAGMTRLQSGEFQANVHLLMPRTRMSDRGSSATGAFGEQATDGGNGGNPYEPTPVPNLYWAERYGERLWLGVGLTAPYGLANDYDDDFFGRYDSTETDLKVINLHPSMAFELSERVSIGGGLDLHYANATLRSAIPSPAGPDPDTDGEFKLEGDSWDVGFNLGLQADLTDATRLGLHYRHGVSQNLRGTATITPPAGTGADTNTMSAQAELKLPDIASVALSHEFDARWTGLVQYTWFRWSNFDEIDVRGSGGGSIQTLDQNYRDSYAIALGAEYQANPQWTLRAGIQYDRTPTRDGFRSTRTPDGDRTWYTVGASYRASDRFSFDFGYAYIDVGSESIELESEFANVGVTTETRGRTRGDVHVLSAGLRYRF
ncbi:OmpP1/FadL family transporter [Thioalkalivibrio sp. ALgr1]|uniref:OmpP1/FadL family transporter n=1 Tax=Thioalkalivibrio sp. ALgr1 TaxID=748655 RepID=UPI0003687114|nr:TonB-dependent receptor [Thioalkalivibrio sp. ALgr1]